MSHLGYELELEGLVQGVGFRPFVYKLALKKALFGEVYNNAKGVIIRLYCDEKALNDFIKELQDEKPSLARIDKIEKKEIECFYEDFRISSSKSSPKSSAILSDFAICSECKEEFYDEKNPRFKYPFTTCTHCGVRYSIIKALPYDRENTSMYKFKLCDFCKKEYENPKNRRFHAQPLSCPKCKIDIFLKDKNKNIIFKNEDAIKELARLLENEKIIALKGLGGFHLICDAFSLSALKELRIRKNRAKKPFAIMCKDLKMAENLAYISQKEAEALSSKESPIVLLQAKKELELISFNSKKIGIMLAYTPLHLLLFEYFNPDLRRFKRPLVKLSAHHDNLAPEVYAKTVLFIKELKRAPLQLVEVNLDNIRCYHVILSNGAELILGRNNDNDIVLKRLRRFVDVYRQTQMNLDEINYVDLRYDVGFAVNYKKESDTKNTKKQE